MLIIDADDWGLNRETTDNILECIKNDRVTSTTAMVFMRDSLRAAEIALSHGLKVGLHLNFTQLFDGDGNDAMVNATQRRLVDFFAANKYNRVLYNPFIVKQVRRCFEDQLA